MAEAVVVQEPVSWRKALAEGIGTMALIFVGILVLVGGMGARGDGVAIALAHGLTIAVMVSATMSISGGQLNPAVTVALLAIRRITPGQAGVNVLAQLVGGLLGGVLASASLPGANLVGGVPDLANGIGNGTGILIEALLTFLLMFVVMGTAVDPRFGARLGGLAIGLTVTLDILAGGPLTGAAMNPARWFGAAIPAGHYNNAIVYFLGPVLGALLGALVYEHFLLREPRPHPEPQAQMRAKDNP